MLSNEAKALGRAIDTIQKALEGSDYESAVNICGGRLYDDMREVCARIIAIADTIKAGGLPSGGGGTVDQTARDMAQAAQNTANNKVRIWSSGMFPGFLTIVLKSTR